MTQIQTAFDTAWQLVKEMPRFAVHRGRVPIGEPIDPSVSHDYSLRATLPHNEILDRPHGVFSHPIANREDEDYRMSMDFLLNDLRNMKPRLGHENDGHFIIDMEPYADETIAGNMRAADALGFLYQGMEEAIYGADEGDWEGYDQDYLDEMKEIMARKYRHFNKPAKDWMGDDDDVIIGGDQMIDFGQGDMMFEITDPTGASAPLQIPDQDDMHEFITQRVIDPEDVLPMYGNSQKKIREWMADRVRG